MDGDEGSEYLLSRIKAAHFYGRPAQQKAYPIVEDYRTNEPEFSIINRKDIISMINIIRINSYGPNEAGSIALPSHSGTLHVIIEFDDRTDKAAYYIIYLSPTDPLITPIFGYDAATFECEALVSWITEKHPEALQRWAE